MTSDIKWIKKAYPIWHSTLDLSKTKTPPCSSVHLASGSNLWWKQYLNDKRSARRRAKALCLGISLVTNLFEKRECKSPYHHSKGGGPRFQMRHVNGGNFCEILVGGTKRLDSIFCVSSVGGTRQGWSIFP